MARNSRAWATERVSCWKRVSKARSRAERWNSDKQERHRAYRRQVAQLQSGLVERKRRVGPRRQQIIDEASIFLAQEIG